VDGLVLEDAIQFLGHLMRALVTPLRFLLEALEANRLQITRHARVEQTRRDRLLLEHLLKDPFEAVGLKRRAARDQMIEGLRKPSSSEVELRHESSSFGVFVFHGGALLSSGKKSCLPRNPKKNGPKRLRISHV
jgi:hypothetical protein